MSQKKENRADFNASVGKVLLSGLVILALVGGLWLLYSTTREGAARIGPVAGKAVGGFGQPGPHRGVLLGVLDDGILGIDPVSADAALSEEIQIDVVVNPTDLALASPARFNNYIFVLTFNPAVLTYTPTNTRNLVGGSWDFSADLSADGGTLTVTGTSVWDSFGEGQTALAQISFTPVALGNTQIRSSGFININAYAGGESAIIVSGYEHSTINIYNRLYPDVDGDGFGNNSDPGFVGAVPPGRYIADHSDCSDNDIAVNPDAVEECDGIDNNCDAGIADEVPPTCGDLRFACGIHRVCNNPAGVPTRFLDCNKAGVAFDGALLFGAQKCADAGAGAGFICDDDGQCVDPNADCPPEVVCPGLPDLVFGLHKSLTPACGDGVCDYFETTKTCATDCPLCPEAVADDCTGDDNDADGLSNQYEAHLDLGMQAHGFALNVGFNTDSSDSDNDGVKDGLDFCPGTDVTAGQSVANGRINVNGCYAGDVGTENAGVRPDGCFSLKDSTFLIDYYVGRAPERACTSDLK